ncbi:MAG: diaminopimelate epimerase [Hyphomicrobiales bacterium]|nr:diaminopimelate epimerase [Hyphomicrobiales bacterium]
MNGAGNKILVLDLRDGEAQPSAEEARAIHRARGLDYDQMMVLGPARSPATAAYVRIFNNDGSLAEACGNGARCVADRLCRESNAARVDFETEAGVVACERLGPSSYRVDMGPPQLDWRSIPLAEAVEDARRIQLAWRDGDPIAALGPACAVGMGNPHAVFFVSDLEGVDAARWGARIEVHPMFPAKANVSFARIDAPDRVTAKVWERGVGLTLACGSAACAILVAAARLDLMDRKGTVRLPGGELLIEWRASDDHVLMTGPVEFEGEFVLDRAILEGAWP